MISLFPNTSLLCLIIILSVSHSVLLTSLIGIKIYHFLFTLKSKCYQLINMFLKALYVIIMFLMVKVLWVSTAIFFHLFISEMVPKCIGRKVATRCSWSPQIPEAVFHKQNCKQGLKFLPSFQCIATKERDTRSQVPVWSLLWKQKVGNVK